MACRKPTYRVDFVSQHGHREQFHTSSEILRADAYHDNSRPHEVSSSALETYGDPAAPNVVRIGNGGLGPTGLLRALCETYLEERDLWERLRIEWVCNHSRHTQVALQAGVVDIGLTYERAEEDRAELEGWSTTIDMLCHDHFVLVGPRDDPAAVTSRLHVAGGFDAIATRRAPFHTRGDGSATMHKEHQLWTSARVTDDQRDEGSWYQRVPGTPMEALDNANKHNAYLLTDRATYIVAKQRGLADGLAVFFEGGDVLLNSCAIVVRSDEDRDPVCKLVAWLREPDAQEIIATYGEEWDIGLPLVTPSHQREVDQSSLLRTYKQSEVVWKGARL
ncbi:uncharacterized protein EHS24_003915 [Apiotrichum porosum]|uniref:PBP domain-containing protein n=1 Tax=Apiotrichum porosum TaxID=105984 RepID=A0A427XDQ0_9TREE|nr:uncharacterized protein EHS24_003915 [Apiotrichum porosum]RSH76976.1 hypothetical protein EHS24_003915 [Apiotrichum porosum]